MAIEVNGVTLPDIPVVEGYPYAVMCRTAYYEFNIEGYALFFAKEPLFVYKSAEESQQVDAIDGACDSVVYLLEDVTDTDWVLGAENPNTTTGLLLEDSEAFLMEIVWANYDVCYAESADGTTYVPSDEIYFPSSVVAEPEYGKIRRAIMRGIANAIRRKTGGTDKIPPEQMEEAIDGIVVGDISLCHVISTATVDGGSTLEVKV